MGKPIGRRRRRRPCNPSNVDSVEWNKLQAAYPFVEVGRVAALTKLAGPAMAAACRDPTDEDFDWQGPLPLEVHDMSP